MCKRKELSYWNILFYLKNNCEAIIIETYDINKFNLTNFESRIQNLINLQLSRKNLNVFFLLLLL